MTTTIIIIQDDCEGKGKYLLKLLGTIQTQKIIIMGLTLQANQFSLGQLALVDADDQSVISATFSNQVFVGGNDSAFSVKQDDVDPNTVKVSGVAEGSGQLKFTATASFVNKFGQSKTQDLGGEVDVTVTAVQQEQNVSLVVNFGAPQNS